MQASYTMGVQRGGCHLLRVPHDEFPSRAGTPQRPPRRERCGAGAIPGAGIGAPPEVAGTAIDDPITQARSHLARGARQ